jgi:hypothetical protein
MGFQSADVIAYPRETLQENLKRDYKIYFVYYFLSY